MEKWLLDNLWAIFVFTVVNSVAVVVAFVRLQYKADDLVKDVERNRIERGKQVDKVEQEVEGIKNDLVRRLKDLETDFKEHIKSELPHTSCPVHTLNLENVQKTLSNVVSENICKKTHEDLNRRMGEFHATFENMQKSIQELSISLAGLKQPLLQMKGWVEELKNGKT
jgi:hypothetical protein